MTLLKPRQRLRRLQERFALVGRVPSRGALFAFPSECEISRLADAREALPCLHNARDDERERREYLVKAELPALRSSQSAYPPLIPQ
jgi:hypothetical protein